MIQMKDVSTCLGLAGVKGRVFAARWCLARAKSCVLCIHQVSITVSVLSVWWFVMSSNVAHQKRGRSYWYPNANGCIPPWVPQIKALVMLNICLTVAKIVKSGTIFFGIISQTCCMEGLRLA